jgi:fatty-acyl-CoA synthase
MSILSESQASRISGWDAKTVTACETIAPQNDQSYVRGPAHPPLAYITIPQLLHDAVSRFGPGMLPYSMSRASG